MYGNEATSTDLKVIKALEILGWKPGDTLLYQPSFTLDKEQQREYKHSSIKPDIVLIDPYTKKILAVFENKYKNEKKAFSKLRMIYGNVLNPRFLYACSENKYMFYDTSWRGLQAGEFKKVSNFMSYEQMKLEIAKQKKKLSKRKIIIDTTIAGGLDPNINKERTYQKDCIEILIQKYKEGKPKMLVHMATGLGKTRTIVALSKALIQYELAKRILFVVDRRMLAKQAHDESFALISSSYKSAWITTSNFRSKFHLNIHVVVIDTLERIHQNIPSGFYDLIVVDECHRSISLSRQVILDHFHCSRIGLTATPRKAVAAKGKDISDEDLAVLDTYRMFGCEVGEPDYEFGLERGIREGFLAPYDIKKITTSLTELADKTGVEFDYILDPDERKKIKLGKTKKLKLEQLNKKILSEEIINRIAEEIRLNTDTFEKVILFGASQIHCQLLRTAINKAFGDEGNESPRYCEAIVSDNSSVNEFIKGRFKKPNRKPYIVTSVDIMSTGVDVPCVRYISFAALTKSVGKYIQMVGRGTRLHPQSGKFNFRILDFVKLTEKMDDNGFGTDKENVEIVREPFGGGRAGEEDSEAGGGSGGGGGGINEPREYYLIDNKDPKNLITRTYIAPNGDIEFKGNMPIEEARKIFEDSVKDAEDEVVSDLKKKAKQNTAYQPSDEELEQLAMWINAPEIYLDEEQLQKIYQYPEGSNWEFLLHAMGVKKIPTPKERIERGYESYVDTYDFENGQLKFLKKVKKIFIANLTANIDIDLQLIFKTPFYEQLLGSYEEVNEKFDGRLEFIFDDLKSNLRLPDFD